MLITLTLSSFNSCLCVHVHIDRLTTRRYGCPFLSHSTVLLCVDHKLLVVAISSIHHLVRAAVLISLFPAWFCWWCLKLNLLPTLPASLSSPFNCIYSVCIALFIDIIFIAMLFATYNLLATRILRWRCCYCLPITIISPTFYYFISFYILRSFIVATACCCCCFFVSFSSNFVFDEPNIHIILLFIDFEQFIYISRSIALWGWQPISTTFTSLQCNHKLRHGKCISIGQLPHFAVFVYISIAMCIRQNAETSI